MTDQMERDVDTYLRVDSTGLVIDWDKLEEMLRESKWLDQASQIGIGDYEVFRLATHLYLTGTELFALDDRGEELVASECLMALQQAGLDVSLIGGVRNIRLQDVDKLKAQSVSVSNRSEEVGQLAQQLRDVLWNEAARRNFQGFAPTLQPLEMWPSVSHSLLTRSELDRAAVNIRYTQWWKLGSQLRYEMEFNAKVKDHQYEPGEIAGRFSAIAVGAYVHFHKMNDRVRLLDSFVQTHAETVRKLPPAALHAFRFYSTVVRERCEKSREFMLKAHEFVAGPRIQSLVQSSYMQGCHDDTPMRRLPEPWFMRSEAEMIKRYADRQRNPERCEHFQSLLRGCKLSDCKFLPSATGNGESL
jgi:hypothetical protein